MENNNGASKSKKNSRFWQNRRQNRSTSNTNGQDRRPPAAAPNGNPLSLHGMREMFHYVLRCNTTAAAEQQQQDFSPVVLWWHSPAPVVPYDVEESMIAFLVPHQSRERGMFRDQPQHRLRKLEKLCETKPISIRATLSLRRHHMKEFNPYLRPSQLRLGSEELALESATLFEQAVEDFLQQNNVSFYSETEQKAHNAKYQQQGDPSPPTPDFVLKEPITIKQWIQKDGTTNERRILQERSVNCKYYANCRIALRAVSLKLSPMTTSPMMPQCKTGCHILQGLKSKCFMGPPPFDNLQRVRWVLCKPRLKSMWDCMAKAPLCLCMATAIDCRPC